MMRDRVETARFFGGPMDGECWALPPGMEEAPSIEFRIAPDAGAWRRDPFSIFMEAPIELESIMYEEMPFRTSEGHKAFLCFGQSDED